MNRLITFIFFFSFIVIGSCNDGKGYDEVKYIEIENKELRRFLIEYLDQVGDGVTTLDILYDGVYVTYHQIDFYENDFIAPLTYTRFNNDIVLIYSGQERLLQSERRKREAIELINKRVPVIDSINSDLYIPPNYHPPTGYLILCGDSLQALRYKEIGHDLEIGKHFNLFERSPCVIYDDEPEEIKE